MAWPRTRHYPLPPKRKGGWLVRGKYPVPPKSMQPYLGDTGNVLPFRAVQHRPYEPADRHWAKRGAVVVFGVLAVWYGIIAWVLL